LVEEVYEGKIAAARERFISGPQSSLHRNSEDLYYNDGYSSVDDKQGGGSSSFAKFKQWQKKQTLEKKQKEFEDDNIAPMKTLIEEEEMNDFDDDVQQTFSNTFMNAIKKTGSNHNSHEKRDEEVERVVEKPKVTSPVKEITTKSNSPQSPKNIAAIKQSALEPESPVKAPIITVTPETPINKKQAGQAITKDQPNNETVEEQKDHSPPKEEGKGAQAKAKLKGFLSVLKFTKKKSQEIEEPSESSSESELNPQEKDDNTAVLQKVKKLKESNLITSLEILMAKVEDDLKEQKENYEKMSLNFKLQQGDNSERFIYMHCPKTSSKARIQAIENPKNATSTELRCLAIIDIIQFFPAPLVSEDVIENYLDTTDLSNYSMDDFLEHFKGQAIDVWKRILSHASCLSRIEPKWKESIVKVFSELVCKTMIPQNNIMETRGKVKLLIKTLIAKTKSNIDTTSRSM